MGTVSRIMERLFRSSCAPSTSHCSPFSGATVIVFSGLSRPPWTVGAQYGSLCLDMAFPIQERRHSFSFDEYAAIAEGHADRLEYWEGAILDMSGGSPRHSAICGNLIRILGVQLRGARCRVFDANLRVRSVLANRATYADATVVCGALELDPADKTRQTVLNPAMLVEVASPSTESDDRGPKLDAYRSIASVRLVLLVSQDASSITVHERCADGSWKEATHEDGTIALEPIGCALPVGEVYEDLPTA